eukprot:411786-Pyramimonas_sp.AAC.1
MQHYRVAPCSGFVRKIVCMCRERSATWGMRRTRGGVYRSAPRVKEASPLGEGDDRDRASFALSGERGSVERVHSNIHRGPPAVANLLPTEQHGGLVLLALSCTGCASA